MKKITKTAKIRLEKGEHPLAVLREELTDYSQRQLGAELKLGRSYVYQVERGINDGSIELYTRIALLLNIPLHFFFMGTYWEKKYPDPLILTRKQRAQS